MKVVCQLRAVVRLAVVCVLLGMVLGLLLGARVHSASAPEHTVTIRPSSTAALDRAADETTRPLSGWSLVHT